MLNTSKNWWELFKEKKLFNDSAKKSIYVVYETNLLSLNLDSKFVLDNYWFGAVNFSNLT